jgi:hypothetical protein
MKPKAFRKKKGGIPTFDVPVGTPMIPGMLAYTIQADEGIV